MSNYVQEMLKDVISTSNTKDSARRVIQRTLIKMNCERDYSAQEVAHFIMGLNYYSSGNRTFCQIYMKGLDRKTILCNASEKRFIEKYHNRKGLKDVSLWQTAKYYDLPSERI